MDSSKIQQAVDIEEVKRAQQQRVPVGRISSSNEDMNTAGTTDREEDWADEMEMQ